VTSSVPETDRRKRRHSSIGRVALALSGLVLFAIFIGLGIWQIERRGWKLALIARVDERVHAPPVAAPGPAEWTKISAARDEYRHVRLSGHFLNDKETQVYTATDLGPGYWVVTPLKRDDGTIVLVDRGFVPMDKRDPRSRPQGESTGETKVVGLLRISEPKGTFLRDNVPSENRWYSRDVAAIAKARNLSDVAPYFVDADATPNPGGLPVGGLTRIHFRNAHLQYAVTWFAMALLVVVAAIVVIRQERKPDASIMEEDV
jgi:surfeit locus 1 family protein